MALKKVVEIDGYPELKITYVQDLKAADGTPHYGECHGEKKEIKISLKMNKTQAELDATVYHELVHYILYKTGWGQILEDSNLSEEGLVIMFENHTKHLTQFK